MEKTDKRNIEIFSKVFNDTKDEVSKIIVGNEKIIECVLISLLAPGHILLEGIPGVGKTKLVQTIANVLKLNFSRIQFTPDLMPGDVIGTNVVVENEKGQKKFEFQKGPLFSNVVLADEINRATPKTQSALLEAMQENSISSGITTYELEQPFFVLATQNPIEMEGTYALPEAQMDRFLFKLKLSFPTSQELSMIVDRTTSKSEPKINKTTSREKILMMRGLVRSVLVAKPIQDYAVRLILLTHPENEESDSIVKKYVRFGSSPRGLQALILAAKVKALINDRTHVSISDISSVAIPALRHRILLNFEAESENIDTDYILSKILEKKVQLQK